MCVTKSSLSKNIHICSPKLNKSKDLRYDHDRSLGPPFLEINLKNLYLSIYMTFGIKAKLLCLHSLGSLLLLIPIRISFSSGALAKIVSLFYEKSIFFCMSTLYLFLLGLRVKLMSFVLFSQNN